MSLEDSYCYKYYKHHYCFIIITDEKRILIRYCKCHNFYYFYYNRHVLLENGYCYRYNNHPYHFNFIILLLLLIKGIYYYMSRVVRKGNSGVKLCGLHRLILDETSRTCIKPGFLTTLLICCCYCTGHNASLMFIV